MSRFSDKSGNEPRRKAIFDLNQCQHIPSFRNVAVGTQTESKARLSSIVGFRQLTGGLFCLPTVDSWVVPCATSCGAGVFLLRFVGLVGICALAFGFIIPTSSRSADIIAVQQASPDLATSGRGAVEVSKTAADDSLSYLLTPFKLASQPNLKQSVFVFAGRTDSGNIGDTFLYGVGAPEKIFYDNYIVGGAYQRDFFHFNSGILIGAEVGLADRFGHYKICCDIISYSSSVLQTAELWGGVSIRHQGVALFDTVRISPGFVFGLSAISGAIGQEAEHQIDHKGSAKILFYLGFDLAFALTSLPNTELVFRVQHRSGAYGTLGAMKEGNNANVVGIRQRF